MLTYDSIEEMIQETKQTKKQTEIQSEIQTKKQTEIQPTIQSEFRMRENTIDLCIHELERVLDRVRDKTRYYSHGCITWNCYLDVLHTIYSIRRELFECYLMCPTVFTRFILVLCSMTEKYFFYQYQQTILSKETYLELVNLFYLICFDYQDEFECVENEYKAQFNQFIQCISVFRTFYAIKTPFHLYVEFIHEYMSINLNRLNQMKREYTAQPEEEFQPIPFHRLFSTVESYYYTVLEFETEASRLRVHTTSNCQIL